MLFELHVADSMSSLELLKSLMKLCFEGCPRACLVRCASLIWPAMAHSSRRAQMTSHSCDITGNLRHRFLFVCRKCILRLPVLSGPCHSQGCMASFWNCVSLSCRPPRSPFCNVLSNQLELFIDFSGLAEGYQCTKHVYQPLLCHTPLIAAMPSTVQTGL